MSSLADRELKARRRALAGAHRVGKDGLTAMERRALADSYFANEARQQSSSDLRAIEALLNSSSAARLV